MKVEPFENKHPLPRKDRPIRRKDGKRQVTTRGRSSKELKNEVIPFLKKKIDNYRDKYLQYKKALKDSEDNNKIVQRNYDRLQQRYDIAVGIAKDIRKKIPGFMLYKRRARLKLTRREQYLIERGKVRESEKVEYAQQQLEKKVDRMKKYHPAVNAVFGYPLIDMYLQEHGISRGVWRMFIIMSQYEWFSRQDGLRWNLSQRDIGSGIYWMRDNGYIDSFTLGRRIGYKFTELGHKRIQSYKVWFTKSINTFLEYSPEVLPEGAVSATEIITVKKGSNGRTRKKGSTATAECLRPIL